MIQQAIHDVIEGQDLSFEAAKEVMNEIMSGETTPAQMAAFLTGLRMKGETIDEITACATVMREKGLKLEPNFAVIDIVGTGGDEAGTFNISTTSAFVVAAGGVPVAKHGNRSVSSKSGAADVLENLGVNLKLTVEQSEQILKDTGMCFMFAQSYHSSMKYADRSARKWESAPFSTFWGLWPIRPEPPCSFWVSMIRSWWNRWQRCSAIWASTVDWWSAATTGWMKLPSPDRPTCVKSVSAS